MADFAKSLRHPKTGEVFVVGSKAEAVRLAAQGYTEVTKTVKAPAKAEEQKPTPKDVTREGPGITTQNK